MAAHADELVERFRGEALPRIVSELAPERVLLFGSRARGDALRHSDLDVVLVADAFRDIPWLDRAAHVIEACDIRLPVELLCYTPEEFARKVEELGIVRTAVEEGIELVGL